MVWSQFLLTLSALMQAQSSVVSQQTESIKTGKVFKENCEKLQSELGTFIEPEASEPETTPLNLSKPLNIWSPARTLECQSTSYLTPNLPIFNFGSPSNSSTSSDRRSRRSSKDDPNKIFPVSF